MRRPQALVLWLSTLALGVALGFVLGTRERPLTAQTRAPQSDAIQARGSDEAVYQDLAIAYDRFQGVDRLFETVARVVSPSVVHITARKFGPRENGAVGRFEESGSGVIIRDEA